MKKLNTALSCLAIGCLACLGTAPAAQAQTVLNGQVFTLQELVGVGRLAANLRDQHGETFGSISGLVADASTWARDGGTYSGTFYAAGTANPASDCEVCTPATSTANAPPQLNASSTAMIHFFIITVCPWCVIALLLIVPLMRARLLAEWLFFL